MSTSPPAIRPAARVPLRKLHGPTRRRFSSRTDTGSGWNARPREDSFRKAGQERGEHAKDGGRLAGDAGGARPCLLIYACRPRAPSAPSTSCTGILSRCALTYIAASRTSRRPNSRARARLDLALLAKLIHDDPTSNRAQLLPLGFGQGIDPMHRRRRAISGHANRRPYSTRRKSRGASSCRRTSSSRTHSASRTTTLSSTDGNAMRNRQSKRDLDMAAPMLAARLFLGRLGSHVLALEEVMQRLHGLDARVLHFAVAELQDFIRQAIRGVWIDRRAKLMGRLAPAGQFSQEQHAPQGQTVDPLGYGPCSQLLGLGALGDGTKATGQEIASAM